tara:strand:- start:2545 stop:2754 length:210 start_codon:yes stop_codon:yes gene_type:complete
MVGRKPGQAGELMDRSEGVCRLDAHRIRLGVRRLYPRREGGYGLARRHSVGGPAGRPTAQPDVLEPTIF